MHFKSLIKERKSNFLVIMVFFFLIMEIFGDKRFFVISKK